MYHWSKGAMQMLVTVGLTIHFLQCFTTLSHLHPQQVENCDSNSRLVVDEYYNGKFRLESIKWLNSKFRLDRVKGLGVRGTMSLWSDHNKSRHIWSTSLCMSSMRNTVYLCHRRFIVGPTPAAFPHHSANPSCWKWQRWHFPCDNCYYLS